MINRLSLNHRRTDSLHNNQNSQFNEKENNQKNLNRLKKSLKANELDPSFVVKPADPKNYLTNADSKINQTLGYNSIQPKVDPKSKINSLIAFLGGKTDQAIPLQRKTTNTSQYFELYGKDIITEYEMMPRHKTDFLKNHQVDAVLRARMLDWMVEVTRSYKFIHKSYFSSVQLMDRYFAQTTQKVPVSQLHIVGVVAMYIASKMEEIYPLKVKTIFQKIVHKKITKEALIEMQAKMFEVFDHKVNSWTFFDLALLKSSDLIEDKDEETKTRVEEVISFVAKCILYDYELYTKYDMETLAKVLVRICSKICGLNTKGENYSLTCHEDVVKSYKKFKTQFKGFNNIFKFTDEKIVASVDTYFL